MSKAQPLRQKGQFGSGEADAQRVIAQAKLQTTVLDRALIVESKQLVHQSHGQQGLTERVIKYSGNGLLHRLPPHKMPRAPGDYLSAHPE